MEISGIAFFLSILAVSGLIASWCLIFPIISAAIFGVGLLLALLPMTLTRNISEKEARNNLHDAKETLHVFEQLHERHIDDDATFRSLVEAPGVSEKVDAMVEKMKQEMEKYKLGSLHQLTKGLDRAIAELKDFVYNKFERRGRTLDQQHMSNAECRDCTALKKQIREFEARIAIFTAAYKIYGEFVKYVQNKNKPALYAIISASFLLAFAKAHSRNGQMYRETASLCEEFFTTIGVPPLAISENAKELALAHDRSMRKATGNSEAKSPAAGSAS
jgi:hypothetical protein